MGRRETQRRLALLLIIGTVAAGWVIAIDGTNVTAVANAAAPRRPAAEPAAVHLTRCPFPASLRPAFEAAARDASLPPALLYAVAKIESNLRADAESEAGARGLLQVMPETGRMLALNIDEPHANVLAGARYLRQLLDRFGSADVALAAYNAGPTAVARAGGAPSIAVQRYVSNVDLVWHSVAGCQ